MISGSIIQGTVIRSRRGIQGSVPVRELTHFLLSNAKVFAERISEKPAPMIVLRDEHQGAWNAVYEELEAIGALPDTMECVWVCFVNPEDEKHLMFPNDVEELMSRKTNVYVAYDETGRFDDIATVRHDIFDLEPRSCEFKGTIDDVREDCLGDIAIAAVLQAKRSYVNAFNMIGCDLSGTRAKKMRKAIEAFGLGYVKCPVTDSDIQEIIAIIGETDELKVSPGAAYHIAEVIGQRTILSESISNVENAFADIRKVISIWKHALRNAGVPMRIQFDDAEDMTTIETKNVEKVAEALGVDTMMEAVFAHGIPIEDVLA